ncbi:DUF1934 domain-containing protein [Pseudogracilibacillus auburnensis]|uniref:Uncharacterized beta-barrel protein YwiB (DUF1934 family) n=1 Tax=Pseudogracilibacillus auburnensis TaxID=1494959 RepID=A0A2V3W2Q4_9BACI|nr:DUF1934 domain-containing protein [Pseudogracilibacillus auburnensis]MBO1002084.1 DUF1934 domain-containing protein [Pseudogracilibacillus auburnensis]PXW87408.1 uncharacterized beta-barrel protein YwiB (DUF1934 family) [Pseudogracilibacillus auburnensis]
MKLVKKNIQVELRTVIDDQGDKELSIIKQIGKYMKKDHIEVVTFIDKTDFGEVNNLITIQPNKVNMKRSGHITMNQQFIEGKVTECYYRHPYGAFHLEVDTLSIQHQILQEDREGKVVIEYETKLNGQEKRYHHLTLIYGGEKE